ncbi:unnamed protein product [Prunus armeniaca]
MLTEGTSSPSTVHITWFGWYHTSTFLITCSSSCADHLGKRRRSIRGYSTLFVLGHFQQSKCCHGKGGQGGVLFTGIVSALAKSKLHFQQLPGQGGAVGLDENSEIGRTRSRHVAAERKKKFAPADVTLTSAAFGLLLGLPSPWGQPRQVDPTLPGPAFVAGTCIWALPPTPSPSPRGLLEMALDLGPNQGPIVGCLVNMGV